VNRREILLGALCLLGLGGLVARAAAFAPKATQPLARGHLIIIGGKEDRTGDKIILRRFAELAGREDPKIAVLTAASAYPELAWSRYDQVLADIGVRSRTYISVSSVDDCNNPELATLVRQSDGILITGGNQLRLLELIGGTAISDAIRQAYFEHGACIAGTSAGAAAMSKHMLAGRSISDGIGLLQEAVVDQHFTERGRLARLVSAVASNPR
jgi:cyanophycinase